MTEVASYSANCIEIVCDGNRSYSILKGRTKDIEDYGYLAGWRNLETLVKVIVEDFGIRYSFYTITIRRNHLSSARALP